jgi:peptide/nickel transport system substrate-binding protein
MAVYDTVLTLDHETQQVEPTLRDGKGGGACMMANLVSARTPNSTTVVYQVSAPEPAFLGYLTTVGGAVANPTAIGTPGLATTPSGSVPPPAPTPHQPDVPQ